jgi:hypothetical protein
VAAFSQRGDELIGHGFSNATRQGELNETAERALLLACRDRMQQQNGKAPKSWLGPAPHHHSQRVAGCSQCLAERVANLTGGTYQ